MKNKPLSHKLLSLYSGILFIVIGFAAFLGWQFGSLSLIPTVPGVHASELLCAAGLMICGFIILTQNYNKVNQTYIATATLALIGVLLLLQSRFGFGLSFGIPDDGGIQRFVGSTGVIFILLSCSLVLSRYSHMAATILHRGLPVIASLMALFGIFGLLYLSADSVAPHTLAITLMFRSGLVLVALYWVFVLNKPVFRRYYFGKLSVMALVVILLVQAGTFAIWRQTEQKYSMQATVSAQEEVDKLHNRFEQSTSAYVNALQGFKGLYASSNIVDQNEFQNYYDSIDLVGEYPGLRNIAFIQIVRSKDLPTFSQSRKLDDSLGIQANKNFSYKNLSTHPTHYIITYLSSAAHSTSIGRDLSSNDDRKQLFETVLATGKPQTSNTIVFPANNLSDTETGFFISMPVTLKDSVAPIGFANATFSYQRFFDQTFKKFTHPDIAYTIKDSRGTEIYKQGTKPDADFDNYISLAPVELQVLTTSFQLSASAPRDFRLGDSINFSFYVFIIGQVFSALLLAAFLLQSVALRRAVDFAKRIERDQSQLKSSINSLRVGYMLTEPSGAIVIINKTAERMLHIKQRTSHIDQLMDKQLLPSVKSLIAKSEHSRQHVHRKNLEIGSKTYSIDVNPVSDDSGNQIGSVTHIEDITESVVQARSRDEFFSIASHELRTPLTAIRGNIKMIQDYFGDRIDDDDFNQMVADIHESSVRLIGIVNDFLDASRLEQNKIQLVMDTFSVQEIIDSVVNEMSVAVGEKQNKLFSDSSMLQLPLVYADRNRVKQIVYNLLGNAMKFTEAGTIVVSAAIIGKNIKISVTDSGSGISEVNQKLLFHKFQQASDNLLTRDGSHGTGLGLYISKLLCERMGGHLSLDRSEVGVGSTFSFTLPVATASDGKNVVHL